jgi:hypothetical protein
MKPSMMMHPLRVVDILRAGLLQGGTVSDLAIMA